MTLYRVTWLSFEKFWATNSAARNAFSESSKAMSILLAMVSSFADGSINPFLFEKK
jgi:hypothetical protein